MFLNENVWNDYEENFVNNEGVPLFMKGNKTFGLLSWPHGGIKKEKKRKLNKIVRFWHNEHNLFLI